MRKLRVGTDYLVGEELIYNDFIVKVVSDNGENACVNCVLFSTDICKGVLCTPDNREDNKPVHFENT